MQSEQSKNLPLLISWLIIYIFTLQKLLFQENKEFYK